MVERFKRSDKLSAREKQDYIEAAKQFRLPYWDYYRPRNYEVTVPGVFDGEITTAPFDYHMPQIFTLPKVMIKTLPDNELREMDNPLFKYDFAESDLLLAEWKASTLDVSLCSRHKQFVLTRKQITIPGAMKRTIRYKGNDSSATEAMNKEINKIREDEMRCSLVMIETPEYSNFQSFSTAGVGWTKNPNPSEILKKKHRVNRRSSQ